jgi:hypothetical protein
MLVGRCSWELSGRKLHRKIKKSQTLSGAPHTDLSRDTALRRGVEEPVLSVAEGIPRVLILLMPFAPFQPPKPAPGGRATAVLCSTASSRALRGENFRKPLGGTNL